MVDNDNSMTVESTQELELLAKYLRASEPKQSLNPHTYNIIKSRTFGPIE